MHNGYSFFPSELSLVAYNTLFENGSEVVRCYINSVFVTILGTILAVCITAMASYALVTPTVKYSNAIAMFFFCYDGIQWRYGAMVYYLSKYRLVRKIILRC